MRSFIYSAAIAVAAVLSQADRASAQYVYGYQTYVPGGAVVAQSGYLSPFNYGYGSGYVFPWTGVAGQQVYYGDYFGNRAAQAYTYNPWTNLGLGSVYYSSPGTFIGPYYTGPYARQRTFYFRR
jgi:hypothetical protein